MPGSSGAARFARLMDTAAEGCDMKGRTARSGAYAMGAEAVEFFLRLASIIVLARLLAPEHFGLIAMVTAITSIADRFKDLGLSIATVQRAEITHEQVSTLFWVNGAFGVAVTMVVAALAWPIARFYVDDRLVLITAAIGSSFLWSGLAVQHQALLRRRMQFGRIALVQIASSSASIVVALVLALADFGYWALVAREVSRGVFLAFGSWLAMPWLPGPPRRGTGVRSMLAFGGDVTAFNLIAFLAGSLDQILIGKLFGPAPLGLYRQGINLVLSPMTQLTHPVNSVAESVLSRLQPQPDKFRRYYGRILGLLATATMPLAVFLAVFAEQLVVVALGTDWLGATPFFQLLAIAAFLRPPMGTLGSLMVSCGFSRRYLWWGLSGSGVIVASLALGSFWGPIGIAYAHVAWTVLWLVPGVYWGLHATPVRARDFAGALFRPTVASLVLAVVLLWILHGLRAGRSALEVLTWGMIAGAPAYLGAWLLLPGGRAAELRALIEVIRSAVGRGR